MGRGRGRSILVPALREDEQLRVGWLVGRLHA